MIYHIPENWVYSEPLEMLYLFYQKADELLSEMSPDTFSLPLHNTMTLVGEMEEIYNLLIDYDLIETYYLKYIPPIIEEFLSQLEDDYILKRILGQRLFSIRTGFIEAQHMHVHLSKWLDLFHQACVPFRYRIAYKNEIIRLITETKDKNKLQYCMTNYFVSLVRAGYSREYLYSTTKRFFSNKSNIINNSDQIQEYLDLFTCRKSKHDFLILMNTDAIEYIDGIVGDVILKDKIQIIEASKERKELCKDSVVEELFKEYDRRVYQSASKKSTSIVRFSDEALDPYSATSRFYDYISFLQTFTRYFKHNNFQKQVYKVLFCRDNKSYCEIKVPNRMLRRPYVAQEIIDQRIKNILQGTFLSFESLNSLTYAVMMHADAFDSRSTSILLRTFWTALESLFSNPAPNSVRDNVINSVVPIIQKTYLLKVLRAIYSQVCGSIALTELNNLGIIDFASFIKYFSSYGKNSVEMKSIYGLLHRNPLLRSRLFSIREALGNGNSILKYLENHKTRIVWQLKRLYRTRNIATHIGKEISGIDVAVNHLHNYFDYVVNYVLCKSENDDYVVSISALVSEAKNDNQIYYEVLKKGEELSENNYLALLFGPDTRLINYRFEH